LLPIVRNRVDDNFIGLDAIDQAVMKAPQEKPPSLAVVRSTDLGMSGEESYSVFEVVKKGCAEIDCLAGVVL
jgi:hypothetical protein